MSANYVTELLPPVVATSKSGMDYVLDLSGSWRTAYGEGEAYVYMDCCWDASCSNRALSQIAGHYGKSEIESDSLKLNRLNYYPNSGEYLNAVRYRVRGVFPGNARWTSFWNSPVVKISAPPAPKVTIEATSDDSTYEVKVKVEAGSYDDPRVVYEHFDFEVNVRWMGTRTATVEQTRKSAPLATSFEESFDISTAEAGLKQGEYILFSVTAWARGVGGRSQKAYETYVFAQPLPPVIKGISTQGDRQTGIVCVAIDAKNAMYTPVDSVSLERTKSSAQSADELAYMNDLSWTQVRASDGGDCTGLTDNLADAYPDFGERTYYRAKSTHGRYVRYSKPFDMGIYKPLPVYEPGCAYIYNTETGDDGQSVAIDVAWQADSVIGALTTSQLNAYKGVTRLSYSDFEHAWYSTDQPSEFFFEWSGNASGPITGAPSSGYANSGRVWLTGLEQGKRIFVCAQRVLKGSGDDIEGKVSNKVSVIPSSAPASVRAIAPKFVARGSSLAISWAHDDEAIQSAWAVVDADSGEVMGAGQGSDSSFSIAAERLEADNVINLYVMMTTGGKWSKSDIVTTRIVEAPTAEAIALTQIASMPFSITAGSSCGVEVGLSIVSRGIVYETPQGTMQQHAGDVAWSGKGAGNVTVDDASLVNGCTYDVVARATDEETGLSTETVPTSFTVGWSHLAGLPLVNVEADPEELSAKISVFAPEGAKPDDVFDLYRSTPDGHALIASGISFGSTVIDRYAPFAHGQSGVELSYRVCTRTADGDLMWVDAPYELEGNDLVCDFGTERLHLPYDIDANENFIKRFERHAHMNGDTHGTWAKGTDRDASLSTDVVKVEHVEKQRAARALAWFDGPVLVRLPFGIAIEGNVDVHIATLHDSAAVAIALDVAEIDITDEFKPGQRDIEEISDGN